MTNAARRTWGAANGRLVIVKIAVMYGEVIFGVSVQSLGTYLWVSRTESETDKIVTQVLGHLRCPISCYLLWGAYVPRFNIMFHS